MLGAETRSRGLAMTPVCVAGATGWTGRAVCEGILASTDLTLTAAVARSAAGRDLGAAWGAAPIGITVSGAVEDALDGVDVLVDYTSHEAARRHALVAVERGVHVVMGSSGLTAADYSDIDAAARENGVGVVAAGNFSVTAAMAQAAALLVAPYLPQREIIDYASSTKPDAPSGTSRELAERLGEISATEVALPVADTAGHVEARGATIAGTQVHSLRLPSFVVSTEIVFAMPDERLVIRHDAGGTPAPYVAGTLIAVRAASAHVGLIRGLDTLLLSRA
jgi:4-hydroxy-tetrahydrodipicolinate reductase